MITDKKTFDTQYEAEKFAREVKGYVRQSYLPNYMSVDVIWIVEYSGEESYEQSNNQC